MDELKHARQAAPETVQMRLMVQLHCSPIGKVYEGKRREGYGGSWFEYTDDSGQTHTAIIEHFQLPALPVRVRVIKGNCEGQEITVSRKSEDDYWKDVPGHNLYSDDVVTVLGPAIPEPTPNDCENGAKYDNCADCPDDATCGEPAPAKTEELPEPTESEFRELMAEKDIHHELRKAEAKFPTWPVDILHAVAVLQEEAGELQRATLQYVYEGGSIESVMKEAIQTGAMVLRFLKNLPNALPIQSEQK